MRFGRGSWHWHDLLIFGLAAVMVYPDKFLDWLGERTGRVFGWRHIALLEALAIGATFVLMIFLVPADTEVHWWRPLLAAGSLAILRVLHWMLGRVLGIND